MTSILAKLNLRPQEQRLVVLVFFVLFAVINFVWVLPHFGDWDRVKHRLQGDRKKLETYRAEILKAGAYRIKLRELESFGSSVLPEEQALDLVRIVNDQAIRHKLNVTRADPRPRLTSGSTRTNSFFEEEYVTIHVNTGNQGEELINFLVSLASTNSLIRVRDLNLKPEVSGLKLNGDMTLVASYQKNLPRRSQSSSSPGSPSLASATETSAPQNRSASTQPAAIPAPKPPPKNATPKNRLTNRPVKK